MKTSAIVPASNLQLTAPALLSKANQDLAQQSCWLEAHQLCKRWQGSSESGDFVMLDTEFALGQRFLLSWQAWLQCAGRPARQQRPDRLCFVAVAQHPPARADLAASWLGLTDAGSNNHSPSQQAQEQPLLRACLQELLQAWPPLTPNLHLLEFEQGRVRLLLALGPLKDWLPALSLKADAIFAQPNCWQQGQASSIFKALARLATPGASLVCDGEQRQLLQPLRSAGFSARSWPLAIFEPVRHGHALPRADAAPASANKHVVVVGAGVAGAAVARALAQQGAKVTVLEQHAQLASEGSGVPAALFHGTLHRDDNRYARLLRATALQARRDYQQAVGSGAVEGQTQGLLRLGEGRDRRDAAVLWAEMQRMHAKSGLPADWVQALSSEQASAQAGVPLHSPAWFYPGGGWVALQQWVAHALQHPNIRVLNSCCVATLKSRPNAMEADKTAQAPYWALLAADGATLAAADDVVLANTGSAQALLLALGHQPWPLQQSRGQISLWPLAEPCTLRIPVTGGGYVLQTPRHGAAQPYLISGASDQTLPLGESAHSGQRSAEAHQQNAQRLKAICGLEEPLLAAGQGPKAWAGIRLRSADRLPLAGQVSASMQSLAAGGASSKPPLRLRDLPREPGLFVLTALGSRGATLAPLLGRLLAAQVLHQPLPLEQDLVQALDPGRWLVKAARRG